MMIAVRLVWGEREMPEGQTALVPVEQAEVTIFERVVRAVRLPDGRIAAVFTDLCRALNLERAPQARRVREDDVLGDQLLFAQVEADGGAQPMDVLTAWAIPTWLQGVQVSRLAPEKRPAILAFKREAADVLYRHFSQRQPRLTTPSSLVPSEPVAEPEAPTRDAGRAVWIRYHEQMAAWLAWQEDVEQWRVQVEDRLESAEAMLQLVPEIIERLGPQTLTPEHQRTVQNAVKRLHEIGGYAYATIYAELGEHFHVAKYDQIPESRWGEVAEWFRARLDAAEKRARRG
jgi:hypothetical protein